MAVKEALAEGAWIMMASKEHNSGTGSLSGLTGRSAQQDATGHLDPEAAARPHRTFYACCAGTCLLRGRHQGD